MGEKVQGRSINGRYKIDSGRLRIVWEMEKPKKLYGHELKGRECGREWEYRVEGNKGEKQMGQV